MTSETWTTRCTYDELHPPALAIYCSDGRFTRGVEELVAHLGYDRLDTLTHPGGPALLDLASSTAFDTESVRRSVSFLIRAHAVTEVVLIAHDGCGYYRERYARHSAEEIHAQQVIDLRSAATWVKAVHPGITLDMYFARPSGGRIAFETLTGPAGAAETAWDALRGSASDREPSS